MSFSLAVYSVLSTIVLKKEFTEEYRSRKKTKSSFIMELLKDPKIMVVGKEADL